MHRVCTCIYFLALPAERAKKQKTGVLGINIPSAQILISNTVFYLKEPGSLGKKKWHISELRGRIV